MIRSQLLKHFRAFYFRNYPDDMELQIVLFSIFGALECTIDTTQPIQKLIEEHILNNYTMLNYTMQERIGSDAKVNKKLLKALATGDRRIFSAFNRAGLNNGNGGAALNYLQEQGIIQLEYSREEHPRDRTNKRKLKRQEARHRISHKVLFSDPFLRFWYYFVVPHAKAIQAGDYEAFFKAFAMRQHSYTSLVFEELSEILLSYVLRNEILVSSGSYWDANVEIDLLTITERSHYYVGECKWRNHKINKKELHKITDKCKQLGITPKQILLFSKRGFSKELCNLQSSQLALYSSEDFALLLKKEHS